MKIKEIFLWILIGLVIGSVIYFIYDSSKPDIQEIEYCDITKRELDNVGCASNIDCQKVNGLCDLNNFKCVPSNVNFQLEPPYNKQDCEEIGGRWEKKVIIK